MPFNNISLGRYLVGLWSTYLDRGLCWWTDYRPGILISTPSQYVAPSWSWMSVSGQVQIITPEQFQPAAEILSAECTPVSTANPTEAVSYGQVTLRAKIVPLSTFRGVVGEKARRVFLHVECADPMDQTRTKRVSPATYRPDATPPLEGDLTDATFFAEDPDVKEEELELMKDGPYFGILFMARMFVTVVKPAASGEKGTYERVGSVFTCREGFRWVMEDKSRFFEGADEVINLVYQARQIIGCLGHVPRLRDLGAVMI
ncbi:hypothetical protein QBC34DRAFT_433384 [Podospora aff. communis PSN243]|uniref:Uncharacterized protein n=1 Tax=Podospora aff. communis PSN243 TaxID=3040156 RepID=A0AAV9H7X0_9PEZI|nr:hypothetical protein QBC34DRAFT_433384 [Podospora aff. communis PSN243]